MKRSIAVTLLVAMMPQLTGCTIYRIQQVAPEDLRPVPIREGQFGFAALTTTEGAVVVFDTPTATVKRDTILASVGASRYELPLAQVEKLWITAPRGPRVAMTPADFSAGRWQERGAGSDVLVLGVTTIRGDDVRFDDGERVVVINDTIYTSLGHSPYRIARNDVRQVTVKSVNAPASTVTTLLIVGGVIAAVVAAVSSFSHLNFGGGVRM